MKLNKHQIGLVALGLFSRMEDNSFNKQISVQMLEETIEGFMDVGDGCPQKTIMPNLHEGLLAEEPYELSDNAIIYSAN